MKEIKLIKVGEHYDLYHRIAEENLIIGFASTDNTFVNKLSLKNCQEIENGYDLDELAKTSMNKINILFNHSLDSKSHTIGFRAGWHHALKILGDKKFSEEDMIKCFNASINDGWVRADFYIQSLQQTKWDVEIEMDILNEYNQPKLDTDGCLILKRKI